MINVDFLNISNSKLIGRLLPFWARGRKMSLLIQALLNPLIEVHNSFKQWALEKYIYCHITAQAMSLEWYLTYRLRHHFRNPNHSFLIISEVKETVACFSTEVWRNNLYWHNHLRWALNTDPLQNTNINYCCFNTGLWENELLWNNSFFWENEPIDRQYIDDYFELIDRIIVYAPALAVDVNYNDEDYERDIRYILSQFMVCFQKVAVIILEN